MMQLHKMPRALATLLALLLVACSARDHGRRPVDEKLVLTLEEARAWQHRADVHLADSDVKSAIADVDEVLRVKFPADAREGEEARLDAWARLAKLRVNLLDEAGALEAIAKGRAESARDSFYRAHLETVAGEIFEARGNRLASTDPAGARAAREEALVDYGRAIEIDRRVQSALLEDRE